MKETQTESASALETLCAAAERINPAVILAEELMRKELTECFDFGEIERAAEVLLRARAEIAKVEAHFTALVKTPPAPSASTPTGF
jgi:hypothetical protein